MAADRLGNDTIAAIATTLGPSARVVLRLSGPDSLSIAIAVTQVSNLSAGSAHRVTLTFDGLSCPVQAYTFRAPRSYTGEDSVEFHIPGSPVLAKMLLDDLFRKGARPADPGEFTARAFFNGKMGLTEAEGVAATIAAGNEAELAAGRQLLAGELSRRLGPITDSLAQTLALIEVGIDFSEEDVTFLAADQVRQRVADALSSLEDLLKQSSRFEQLTHEPRIIFAGRPNAGKSSLINALTHQSRAVVSDSAGTTRDVLTARLLLPRGQVQLTDVAGLGLAAESANPSSNPVQQQIDQHMQDRAHQAIESADHVVWIQDCADLRLPIALGRPPALWVCTKLDLVAQGPRDELKNVVSDSVQHPFLRVPPMEIQVSAKTGVGLSELRIALDQLAFGASQSRVSLALNRRHLMGIQSAQESLLRAAASVAEGSPELVAMDLREALDALGSIVGQVTPDDVLGRVFSAFCIGK